MLFFCPRELGARHPLWVARNQPLFRDLMIAMCDDVERELGDSSRRAGASETRGFVTELKWLLSALDLLKEKSWGIICVGNRS
jgi:hypothetical protein